MLMAGKIWSEMWANVVGIILSACFIFEVALAAIASDPPQMSVQTQQQSATESSCHVELIFMYVPENMARKAGPSKVRSVTGGAPGGGQFDNEVRIQTFPSAITIADPTNLRFSELKKELMGLVRMSDVKLLDLKADPTGTSLKQVTVQDDDTLEEMCGRFGGATLLVVQKGPFLSASEAPENPETSDDGGMSDNSQNSDDAQKSDDVQKSGGGQRFDDVVKSDDVQKSGGGQKPSGAQTSGDKAKSDVKGGLDNKNMTVKPSTVKQPTDVQKTAVKQPTDVQKTAVKQPTDVQKSAVKQPTDVQKPAVKQSTVGQKGTDEI